MFIEIRHIRAFLTVASELHFGRAADRLHIAQPALSRTIQSLEAILDVKLLERSTRSVQLTAAGQLFYNQFSKSMREMADAVHATKRISRGDVDRISIGYVDAALCGPMPDILRRFQRDNPAAKFEFSQLASDKIAELLISRRLDCGFMWGPVSSLKLDARCVQSEAPVVIVPISHRLAVKPRLAMHDLAKERFIICGKDSSQVLQHLCAKSGFVPNLHQEVPSLDAVLAFVAAEAGVGICPGGVQRGGRGGIVVKPLIDAAMTLDLYCVWHKENAARLVTDLAAAVTRYSAFRAGETEPEFGKMQLTPAS